MTNTMRLAIAAILLVALPVGAYEERLHEQLTRRSPPLPVGEAVLEAPDEQNLASFRLALWHRLASVADAKVREGFLRLAPTPESFTATRMKELLQLDPFATVHGVDAIEVEPLTELDVLARASRWPDDDRRNQNRFARDEDGSVRVGADGRPLPADPAVLHMGGVEGTPSQAHAHYELLPPELRTDDVAMLKENPARFSMPAEARTFGADFAALYSDLALLAATSSTSDHRWISLAFFGAAMHHVQDVCNQIHTLQVGGYDFFVTAQFEVWKEELLTLGGLLGPRTDLREVGVRIIANHHLLAEDLFADRLLRDPGALDDDGRNAWKSLHEDDTDFLQRLNELAKSNTPFERAAVMTLVEYSSREAPRIYELARKLVSPELSRWRGAEYEGDSGPIDRWLRARDNEERQATWSEFFQLQANGLRRFGTYARARQQLDGGDPEAAAERVARWIVDRESERLQRWETFDPATREPLGLNHTLLASLGLVLVGTVGFVTLRRRRRR